jgi:hypothetical protein
VITTVTRPIIKQCPFRNETDAGTLTITFPGEAPELHNLAARIDEICAEPVTHEEFTLAIADLLPDGTHIRTTWNTGPWSVEVTETARVVSEE